MAADTADTKPGRDAPMMPTGSAGADLDIAREQEALASATADPEAATLIEDDAAAFSDRDALVSTVDDEGIEASEARPG